MAGDFIRKISIDPLNAKLNPTCYLLALLGAHHILHVSRVRVKFRVDVDPPFSLVRFIQRSYFHHPCRQNMLDTLFISPDLWPPNRRMKHVLINF